VEHRYEHNLKIAVDGKAHALVMNYEHETVEHFGSPFSLADRLRFPITLQSLTVEGQAQQRAAVAKLPKATRDLVAKFDTAVDPAVKDDPRYDYRVLLVPMVAKKTDADLAVNFVKLDDLTEDERTVLSNLGRTGTVLIKTKHVETMNEAKLRASDAARRIEDQLPFYFSLNAHTEMWRRLKVRPAADAADPNLTDAKYCIYDIPVTTYLYTDAWVAKVVREIGTVEKFRKFFGKEPRMKNVTTLPQQGVADEQAMSRSA
jgi:hypothetical protein